MISKKIIILSLILSLSVNLALIGQFDQKKENSKPETSSLSPEQPKTSETCYIITPNADTKWERGTTQIITYFYEGMETGADVSLYWGAEHLVKTFYETMCDGEIEWDIDPELTPRDDYYITIRPWSITRPEVSDFFEVYANTLEVERPDWKDVWAKNTYHSVEWSSTGYVTDVKILLYREFTYIETLATSTPNDGQWDWVIANHYPDHDKYTVQFYEAIDNDPIGCSSRFEIYTDTAPKSINAINPISGTQWERDTIQEITWTSTGAFPYVRIELFKGGFLEEVISPSTYNDGSFQWHISDTLPISDDYQIKITDTSSSVYGLTEEFEIYFNSLSLVSPTGADIWINGTYEYIEWESTGHFSEVKIELYKASLLEQTISASTSDDGTFGWNIPSDIDHYLHYRIKISNVEDLSVYAFSDYFEIHRVHQPTTLTLLSPTQGTTWYIGETKDILWGSTGEITAVNIEIFRDDNLVESIALATQNDGAFKWTVSSSLIPSTTYQIKITDDTNSNIYAFSEYFIIEEIEENEDLEGENKDSDKDGGNNSVSGYSFLMLIPLGVSILYIALKLRRNNFK